MLEKWWERWMLNPKAITIADSMVSNPEEWEFNWTGYTLSKGNLQIWVSNGWWFIEIYAPVEEKLGLVGRTLVWWESKKVIKFIKLQNSLENKTIIDSWEKV